MEKEFIPHQQALELKKLGFDEPCIAMYQYPSKDLVRVDADSEGVRNSNLVRFVSAPLYQQVFRWFREKYGVHMFPEKFDEKTWWVEWGYWNSSIFDTYEEAELECLIKMIEIIKNETK